MKEHWSSVFLLVLSLFLLSCGSPGPQDQVLPPSAKVTVHPTSQLVSLDVKDAPMAAVLNELAQQAQLTISIPEDLKADRLTLSFHHLPLKEALTRVLAGQLYAFQYKQTNGSDVIAGVQLFAKHERVPQPDTASSTTLAGNSSQANQDSPSPEAAALRVASALMEENVSAVDEEAPLDQLKQSFSEAQDPAIRSAALQALADRSEEGPVAPMVATALADSDEGVRETALNLLKSSFDPMPIGSLAAMATQDSNSDFRSEAMTLMTDQLMMQDRPKEDWDAVMAALTRGLSDPNPDVREQATTLLAEVSQPIQPTSKWGGRR